MFLNCHSFHSLRYGTIPLDELVELAAQHNLTSLGLTDINTISGIYDFVKKCKAKNIKPIVGIEFRNGDELLFTGLAKNKEGIGELCAFLTSYNLEKKELPPKPPVFEHCFTVYPVTHIPDVLLKNEYVGIRLTDLSSLIQSDLKKIIPRALIFQPVTLRNNKDFELHKVLRSIEHNILLSQLDNNQHCESNELFDTEEKLLKKYAHYPILASNTHSVINECNFEFDFTVPRNKKYYTGSKKGDVQLLKQLAYDGLENRYHNTHNEATKRIEKELAVIEKLEFTGYFLITWDIIRYSQSKGFMHVGRGSGANSIVSYCLGITDICPIELDLYFERFLNESRKSPPDFDIDWSWRERDVMLDYIFKRFKPGHVAFCGTIVTFKPRSVLREIGKVFGLQKEELDALTKMKNLAIADNLVVAKVQELGTMLLAYPNQRSMHSCGIIISDEPITNFTALEMKPKGYPIVQFDMHVAEAIGFEKFDILSQRGLGTIATTVEMVLENRGEKVDIKNISLSKDEKNCNSKLEKGDTLGCFYIESPAMRGLLRRLKCNNYKTLVAASSIIRPGVAQSGMMKEYIFRHNNPTDFDYFHEVFEQELGETYGVMVYQEDVIKIAKHYAGLEASYGDILRRAISGKSRSKEELEEVKTNFLESAKKKGHAEQLSREVYRQIESFAGYSFCKAHSASYAVESYQSLYLKTYYGVEFMVAAVNNGGGFYRPEIYLHEAKKAGGIIHNPCVNMSEEETIVKGVAIYLGYHLIRGIDNKVAKEIIEERHKNGDYSSLENFVRRIEIGIETLQTLIFIGGFRFTQQPKNELIVTARMLLAEDIPKQAPLLIEEPIHEYQFPKLERNELEDAFDEIEILGFSTSCSPFELLKTGYKSLVQAKNLVSFYKNQVKILAYLISTKQVPTKNGLMYFGTWIDQAGDYFDTAHFSNSIKNYPFKGGGCYLLLGKVEVDFHFPTIIISKMAKMPFKPDPRYQNTNERQFKVYERLKEDQSLTFRQPYPQEHEIALPRKKMNH
ncbi:MAG: DNA polymerase III subunit alpha [Flavobacteriales bacterium]